MKAVDQIFELFAQGGRAAYFGEEVSQLEHALQCAFHASAAGARPYLVAAALLHDVGHLLHGLGEDIAVRGVDARHEEGGADWLERHFGPEVTVPIRLHVPAKRYLCAVDPTYVRGLSPASQLSLQRQGGPFTAEEARAFEDFPEHADAVALRRWDDAAKVPGLDVPDLESYRSILEACVATVEQQ